MGSSDVVTLPTTVTTYPALKARIERGAGEIAAASAEVAAALAIERKLRDTQKGLEDTLGVLVDEATDRLIEAIKQEDTPAAVAALDEGANPNRLKWTAAGENDSEEIAMMSALMWAAAKDNADMATLLLDRGADVNQGRTHDGWTALTWAAAAGRVAIVRLLLDRSADPNQAGTNQAGTYTALMFAAMQGHLEVARLLLECSADPNQAPTTGHTPLMFAAMRGHFEVARLLLYCLADPNQARTTGQTALMFAATEGHFEVARLLLECSADPNQARKSGHTALMDAAQMGHFEMVRLLLEQSADPRAETRDLLGGWGIGDHRKNALMCAAEEGHLKITQLLVLHGASCGTRALTVANRHGHQSIAKCLEVIEGWPALKIAATCRLHADARTMLKRGNIDPSDGCTFAELMATATLPADTLWQGSPAPCPATTALVKAAMSSWSPSRHFLYHQQVRTSVHTVLLVANRLWRRHAAESGVRQSIRWLQMRPQILPNELWCVVFKFFCRSDWPRLGITYRVCQYVEGSNDVQQVVMDLVVGYGSHSDIGVSVSTIATALHPRFNGAQIRDAFNWLAGEGHVYSTVDDHHFKWTDA